MKSEPQQKAHHHSEPEVSARTHLHTDGPAVRHRGKRRIHLERQALSGVAHVHGNEWLMSEASSSTLHGGRTNSALCRPSGLNTSANYVSLGTKLTGPLSIGQGAPLDVFGFQSLFSPKASTRLGVPGPKDIRGSGCVISAGTPTFPISTLLFRVCKFFDSKSPEKLTSQVNSCVCVSVFCHKAHCTNG